MRDLIALPPVDAPRDWRDLALCTEVAQPHLWYPEQGESPAAAKAVCASCPARSECLQYALTTDVGRWGVWGGTTEDERRVMKGIRPRDWDRLRKRAVA